MSSYTVHLRDEGECDDCGSSTPYLMQADRLVDAGFGEPVAVAVWVCKSCYQWYGDCFFDDAMVATAEAPADPLFTELVE